MKKLAILAAAAAGYVMANRLGKKSSAVPVFHEPPRPAAPPAPNNPFVPTAPEVPTEVAEDVEVESLATSDLVDVPIEKPEPVVTREPDYFDYIVGTAEPKLVESAPTPSNEAVAHDLVVESVAPVKLSEAAESIVEKVRTAAEQVREDDEALAAEVIAAEADLDDVDAELAAPAIDETAFVIPTAEDYADETFEDDVPSEGDADPVAIDEALLAETALMEAIDDNDLEQA